VTTLLAEGKPWPLRCYKVRSLSFLARKRFNNFSTDSFTMGYGAREKNEKDRNAKSPRRKDAKSFFQRCPASAGAHAARFAGPRLRRDRPSAGARCPTLRKRRQVGAGLGKQARLALCVFALTSSSHTTHFRRLLDLRFRFGCGQEAALGCSGAARSD